MAKRSRKAKKPKITTSTANITAAIRGGRYPKGQAWEKELLDFFGKKGKPLAHKLRSRKARERFNELVKRWNKERPTQAKEKQRQEAIREKQKATVAKNVPPQVAAQAVDAYDTMVDVLQTVHDYIKSNLDYHVILGMMQENPDLTAEDISKFIMDTYNKMQESLPSFARSDDKQLGVDFAEALESLVLDMNTYDMAELEEGINAKLSGDKKYKQFLARRERRSSGRSRGAGSTRSRRKR